MQYIDGYGYFSGLVTLDIEQSNIIFLGVPYESATSGNKGASFGPSALRAISNDFQTVSRNGVDFNSMRIYDAGNVSIYPVEGKDTRDSIEKKYDDLLKHDKPILTMGGDHSITYPILKSLSKLGKVAVIWVDAHRDLLDKLSKSRFSHGSPLRRALELDNIQPNNVLLVGTRYFTSEEDTFVEENRIREIRMVDMELDSYLLSKFNKMVKQIATNSDFLYLSIDIDVLDPSVAPGTGTPVAGGMSSNMLFQLINALPILPRGVDIVEVSPPLDNSGITVKTAMGLMTEILARFKQGQRMEK
ncbi:MAG: agmatinase [Candidatus Heimdallarchaeota archaeon]|nr:agmatinase [Candidatus Heimdallarchaeota archaeon]